MLPARPDNPTFFQRAGFREAADRPWPIAAAAILGAALTAIGSIAPWFHVEHVLETPPRVEAVSGFSTDGTFSLVFALIALLALLAALVRPDTEGAAWAAFALLALCAIVGLYDWMIWDAATATTPDESGKIERIAWGLPLTALAGLGGAGATLFLARSINRY